MEAGGHYTCPQRYFEAHLIDQERVHVESQERARRIISIRGRIRYVGSECERVYIYVCVYI